MLRKMILQGLVAAVLIAGASALYATTTGAGLDLREDHAEERDHARERDHD